MSAILSALEDMSSILYEGRAKISVSEDIRAMIQDWRARLVSVIEGKDMSMRAASLAAGMGPGYVHSIIKEGKDPGVESLLKVCDTLGITLSWLLYGFDIDPTSEKILQIVQGSDERQKAAVLTILENSGR